MNFFLTLSLVLSITSVFAVESKLSSFETDFCTNYPEGTPAQPGLWKHCCLAHDLYFWAGGTKSDRDTSDLELKSCIHETGAHQQAQIMYLAVRAGSFSPIKYPKRRWGNGWSDRHSSQALTLDEIKIIETEISSGYDDISSETINHFINQLNSRLTLVEMR